MHYADRFENKDAKGEEQERAIEKYLKYLEDKIGFQIQSPMNWHLTTYLRHYDDKMKALDAAAREGGSAKRNVDGEGDNNGNQDTKRSKN